MSEENGCLDAEEMKEVCEEAECEAAEIDAEEAATEEAATVEAATEEEPCDLPESNE